jgi:hypothetical protein
MNVNDYNDPIAEFLDDINQLRDQLELKDQILKSVARQGIEQKKLISELADELESRIDWRVEPLRGDLLKRAWEASK